MLDNCKQAVGTPYLRVSHWVALSTTMADNVVQDGKAGNLLCRIGSEKGLRNDLCTPL